MSYKNFFVNFNDYLGGGETLLLRLVDAFTTDGVEVITSHDSYIKRELDYKQNKNIKCHSYNESYNYGYMNFRERSHLLSWLDPIFSSKKHQQNIVTFCMRDLHIVSDYVKKRGLKKTRVTHLLLHPLDHLYLGQTILNKLTSMIFNRSYFSENQNIALNFKILNQLAESGSLIPMNFNTLKRVNFDTGINLKHEDIIPLPFYEHFEMDFKMPSSSDYRENISIVWLGRIVDFKIPAIKTMIDFVSSQSGFTFDIIGYGNESIIEKYISKRKANNKVKILGKINSPDLKKMLSKYDIGYAMGTSMAELTVCGLPTIVALASPDFRSFDNPLCAGLVFEQKAGNVGDNLYCLPLNEQKIPSIDYAMNLIKKNPEGCLLKSLSHLESNFSLNENICRYKKVIESPKAVFFKDISIPYASWFRKMLYKTYSLL